MKKVVIGVVMFVLGLIILISGKSLTWSTEGHGYEKQKITGNTIRVIEHSDFYERYVRLHPENKVIIFELMIKDYTDEVILYIGDQEYPILLEVENYFAEIMLLIDDNDLVVTVHEVDVVNNEDYNSITSTMNFAINDDYYTDSYDSERFGYIPFEEVIKFNQKIKLYTLERVFGQGNDSVVKDRSVFIKCVKNH